MKAFDFHKACDSVFRFIFDEQNNLGTDNTIWKMITVPHYKKRVRIDSPTAR